MANFSQKNHQLTLVGKDVAKTTTTVAALADGEIALFSPGGTMYTEALSDEGDPVVIYLGRAAALGPLKSDTFSKADVTKITRATYTAPTAKVDHIGSNGTSGSIEVNNSTVYRATVNMIESPETNHGGVYVKDLVYESGASAAQSEIALGLTASGYANFSRETEEPISFQAICDDAGAIIPTGTGTFAVNKGSKIISTTDVTDATGATVILVNEFLRFGTTVTSPIYKIISIDTTAHTFTLDRPYQEASNAAVANAAIERITVALGAAANWGVQLTGLTLDWTLGKINDKLANWSLALDSASFGATNLVNTTAPSAGNGTYRQVADLEWFTNGNNGDIYRNEAKNSFPFTGNALAAETYDVIEIEINKGRSGLIATSNPQTISLYIDSGKDTVGHYSLTATADDITDMLEQLLVGVPVYGGAVTANGGALAAGDLALT